MRSVRINSLGIKIVCVIFEGGRQEAGEGRRRKINISIPCWVLVLKFAKLFLNAADLGRYKNFILVIKHLSVIEQTGHREYISRNVGDKNVLKFKTEL